MQLGWAGTAAVLSGFNDVFLEHKTEETQEGTKAAATEDAGSGCGGERPAESREEGGVSYGVGFAGAGNDAFSAVCQLTVQTCSAQGLVSGLGVNEAAMARGITGGCCDAKLLPVSLVSPKGVTVRPPVVLSPISMVDSARKEKNRSTRPARLRSFTGEWACVIAMATLASLEGTEGSVFLWFLEIIRSLPFYALFTFIFITFIFKG